MANIIYQGAPGKLPYSIQFTPSNDSLVTVQLSGSAWSINTNTPIGISVSVEGQQITSASIFNNQASTHRALVPGLANFKFPIHIEYGEIQPITLTFDALNGDTSFDPNDLISFVIL